MASANQSDESPTLPKPPKAYQEFISQYPKLGEAWGLMAEAGKEGPLDDQTVRLVKLAIALGTRQEGAVHSGVRKARAAGISHEAILQVVALAASNIGLPAAVASFCWVRD